VSKITLKLCFNT